MSRPSFLAPTFSLGLLIKGAFIIPFSTFPLILSFRILLPLLRFLFSVIKIFPAPIQTLSALIGLSLISLFKIPYQVFPISPIQPLSALIRFFSLQAI